jgi:hypothetical protein
MNRVTYNKRTLTVLLLVICFQLTSGQNLDIRIQAIDSLNKSNTTNLVYDVNGEVCNLVIVRTELDSLKFYSNRGTERIEKQDSEYRIWVSPATTILRISVPSLPLFEFSLPKSDFPNSVYFLRLSSFVGENIVYKDTVTLKPFLSISSEPSGAKVYIDKKHAGKTPFVIDPPSNLIYTYKIRKQGFSTLRGTDTLDPVINNINVRLEDLRATRRLFISFNDIFYFSDGSEFYHMYGLSIGKIGKTSWYTSIRYNNAKPQVRWDPNYPMGGVYPTYPYTDMKFQITGGLTQQLINSIFIIAGLGYSERQSGRVDGYYDNNVFHLISIHDDSYKGFNTDLGIMIRFLWNFIISANITYDFGFSDDKIKCEAYNFGFGVGINFGAKNNKQRQSSKNI